MIIIDFERRCKVMEKYTSPELEVVAFEAEDVIDASDDLGRDDD